jgi:hypothetical protein
MSGYEYIRTTIEGSGRGRIFFPDDFSAKESSDTIRSALVRLCEDKIIIRLAQGIYCYPLIDDKWGMGVMYPSIDDIAQAIAKKEKCRIAPTGSAALNALGISTQMPANVVYYTDGSPRNLSIGNGRGLLFKRSTDMKRFAYKNKTMELVVVALREIGNGKVTEDDKRIIAEHLKNVGEEDYLHDLTLAPSWVQKILKELR